MISPRGFVVSLTALALSACGSIFSSAKLAETSLSPTNPFVGLKAANIASLDIVRPMTPFEKHVSPTGIIITPSDGTPDSTSWASPCTIKTAAVPRLLALLAEAKEIDELLITLDPDFLARVRFADGRLTSMVFSGVRVGDSIWFDIDGNQFGLESSRYSKVVELIESGGC